MRRTTGFIFDVSRQSLARRCLSVLVVVLASLLLYASMPDRALAADVVLDYAFGTNGVVVTDVSGSSDGANALIRQPDGKLVAAGTGGATGNSFALARYSANGILDTSFGASGKVNTAFGLPRASVRALALQPDGKIVACGSAGNAGFNSNFALARYNADGSLDTNFGAAGKVQTTFTGQQEACSDVLLQPDGKIIAVGYSYFVNANPYYDFAIARYNSDGSPDNTFDGDGRSTIDFAYGDVGYDGILQADGKILVGGYSRNVGTLDDMTVIRLNSNGTLDTTFGTGGRTFVDFDNPSDTAYKIALQSDGKIVAAGGTNFGSYTRFALARFNADGSLDTSFGTSGKSVTSFGDFVVARLTDMAIQPDGKIVTVGILSSGSHGIALARYTPNGSLDPTFDGDGKYAGELFPSTNASSAAGALVLQPDGKIVIAGGIIASAGSPSDFVLARFQTKPLAVPYDFDGDGKADLGVFRPSNGGWYVRQSSNGALAGVQWGAAGDLPEPADFDGDTRSDFVIFRNGAWYIVNSFDSTIRGAQFGTTGDIPVAADYDGDGRADFAVFRPSNGSWYILRILDNAVIGYQLGADGDKPVPGDYNGDGKADVAVWRPSNGTWYTSTSPINNFDAFIWGQSGDIAVPGDYDGDGKNDRAIFRPSTATWWIYQSSNGASLEQQFGASTDQPVPADYDGDGKTNIAVFRPSTGYWYTSLDVNTNFGATLWGQSGDIAVQTSNVP